MTTKEWNQATAFLEVAGEGAWVENDGRTVEVTNMCGGRYLMLEDYYVMGQCYEEWKAVEFLKTGRVYR